MARFTSQTVAWKGMYLMSTSIVDICGGTVQRSGRDTNLTAPAKSGCGLSELDRYRR